MSLENLPAMSAARPGKKCPVCDKNSYSKDGIHPQCAESRSDEPRRLELAAEKKAIKESLKAALVD